MPRAPKRCSRTCGNKVVAYGKCQEHQPEKIPWVKTEESPDRSYLKSAEWQRQRRRVLFRDNNDRGGCQGRYVETCTGYAVTVDHKNPTWYTGSDEVDDEDLQGLCEPCHNFKSSRDGYFAKMARRARQGKNS